MNILNLIFPPKCVGCGEITDGGVFCGICRSRYEQMKREHCRRCGAPHERCRCKGTMLAKSGGFVSERHLFAFDGELSRTVIYKFKRKNLGRLQKFLASECARLLRDEVRGGESLAVIYPPRSESGVSKYGFDQARILAREVSRITGAPLEDIFYRGKSETEQKTLTAKEREENAREAYLLSEGADLTGKCAVIIDDVVTSGSTMARLASLAKTAGAERVIILSVAKTE